MTGLDDPDRGAFLRGRIQRKPALRKLYQEAYSRYAACLERCAGSGTVLELGSGGGFAKEVIPELCTSDVISYPEVDRVIDATRLPFSDGSLRAILMLNVFHHLADAEAFLSEAQRCLVPGGRLLIIDHHLGVLSTPIYRFAHHEPFDPDAASWSFAGQGPLSDANAALAWIVFRRDRAVFEQKFPGLRIVQYRPHTPLRYWLAGGLKRWSLVPGWAFGLATRLDEALLGLSEDLGSFVDVEVQRLGRAA